MAEVWTAEMVEALKAHWAAGKPARWIATELGLRGKNQVLGKVFRLGLSREPVKRVFKKAPVGPLAVNRAEKAPAPIKRIAKMAPPPQPVVVPLTSGPWVALPESRLVRLEQLAPGRSECRWPIGDTQSPDFAFCGGAAVAGRSYCLTHSLMSSAVIGSGGRSKYDALKHSDSTKNGGGNAI